VKEPGSAVVFLLCATLWPLTPAGASASTAAPTPGADSLGSAVPAPSADSLRAVAPATDWIEIELDRGRLLRAREVEPLANGLLRVRDVDGTESTVPAGRVRTIRDERGRDRKHEVLDGWKRLRVGDPAPPVEPSWKPFRFHGGPKSRCARFAVTEFSYLKRLDKGPDVAPDEHTYVSFDVGLMGNVDSVTSVGGSLFVGGDGARSHFGVRVRVRRWITPELGLDLAPGLILGADEERTSVFRTPGFIGRAGLTYSDRMGAVLQVFTVRRSVPPGMDLSPTETVWQGGLQAGSQGGITAALVVGGGLIVALLNFRGLLRH
jgi:hypothetical protein